MPSSCRLRRQVKYRWPARFRGRTQFLREWRRVRSTNARLRLKLHSFFCERVSPHCSEKTSLYKIYLFTYLSLFIHGEITHDPRQFVINCANFRNCKYLYDATNESVDWNSFSEMLGYIHQVLFPVTGTFEISGKKLKFPRDSRVLPS